MIYFYNETTLTNLSFTEIVSEDGTTAIGLTHTEDGVEPSEITAKLINVKTDIIKEAVHNRYGDGIAIKENVTRDYFIVKGHRILMDAKNDEFVDAGLVNQKSTFNPNYVKNMIVLLLHKDSKYFSKKKNTMKKPIIITDWMDDYKIVVMYIKTNNWNMIPDDDPLTVLIQSGYGEDHNVQICMTAVVAEKSETDSKDKDTRTHYHNVFNANPYTGTFPSLEKKNFKKRNNSENTSTEVKTGDDYKYSTMKPDDDRKNNYRNNKQDYSRKNNYYDKDDGDNKYSKKYNGHPKKKKFNKGNDRF